MSNPIEQERRQAVIDGYRALADFLEANPDVPTPDLPSARFFPVGTDEEKRAEVDRVAALFGVTPEPNEADTHYEAERQFGPVTYAVIAIRAAEMRRFNAVQSYAGSVQPEEVSA